MALRGLEFFAGGGMARQGLAPDFACVFANDVDPRKAATYRANFGDGAFVLGDVGALDSAAIPTGDLAWASFPCQDLSLAGAYAGMGGARSGVFHDFWRLMTAMRDQGRAPSVVAIENVTGLLTSKAGADFTALVGLLNAGGYRAGGLVIDGAHWTPQSRPRLFLVAVHAGVDLSGFTLDRPAAAWTSPALIRAAARLPASGWVWWALPCPAQRNIALADVIDADQGPWRRAADTQMLLDMMTLTHRAKVAEARRSARAEGRAQIGAIYRRTREGRQRAEVRFDGLAGCLRTPAGGSSRQTILVVTPGGVRSRLITAREAARLMGLPESYRLPENYTEAYHLLGDGVIAPAVAHLSKHLLAPLARRAARAKAA